MKAVVVGAGPAGLMAAETLASRGAQVTVFEAKPSPARKFLMAGKSGLNLTFEGDFDRLMSGYGDAPLGDALRAFDNAAVRAWAEGLGQEMFTGSTGRVFPKSMKASPLLRAWLARLQALGIMLKTRARWIGWDGEDLVFDTPDGRVSERADVVVLACGGASWSRLGSDGAWAEVLGIKTLPFQPSNVGVSVPWSPHMGPHFGSEIKSVEWCAGNLRSRGEAVLSASGLEGGGVYSLSPALRDGAPLTVDLLPDRSPENIVQSISKKSKKASLTNWLRKSLRLPPVKVALVMEAMARSQPLDAHGWARALKALPLPYDGLAPMDGAISTVGGVPFDALTPHLMLRDRPGVYCAGEMIDWDAPTGGWLLTACLATGAWVGARAADRLHSGLTR